MAYNRSVFDASNDLGRQLTADVALLAVSLPVVASQAFLTVVLPFVYVASVILLVLFVTPFRDVPFVAEGGNERLNVLRIILLALALINLVLPGYTVIETLSGRWLMATGLSVLGLAILTIDLRKVFP